MSRLARCNEHDRDEDYTVDGVMTNDNSDLEGHTYDDAATSDIYVHDVGNGRYQSVLDIGKSKGTQKRY